MRQGVPRHPARGAGQQVAWALPRRTAVSLRPAASTPKSRAPARSGPPTVLTKPPSLTVGRLPLVDALRALASTIIVWHHIALYWPRSAQVIPVVSEALLWLRLNGRATQLFFVIGGFVMAHSLSRRQWDGLVFGRYVVHRYFRLGLPYVGAMVLALGACALGRGIISEYVAGAPPSLPQVLAHLLFLQKILGYESFSAGMWFVCINFQMSLIFAALLLMRDMQASRSLALPLVLAWLLAIAALFYFNLDERWDPWAMYFFAHFFTGVMAYYGLQSPTLQRLFWLYVGATVLALAYRCWLDHGQWTLATLRVMVSLLVGLVLFLSVKTGLAQRWPRNRVVAYLGRTSYSLFLVHFPVLVLVLTLWTWLGWTSPLGTVTGLWTTYLASLLASDAFYRHLETPAARLSREFS